MLIALGIAILCQFWDNHYVLNIASMLTTISIMLIGWSQIKKYDELSESYDFTAKEIENLKNKATEIQDECSFGHWIENAETAFSREHTMWAARINVL